MRICQGRPPCLAFPALQGKTSDGCGTSCAKMENVTFRFRTYTCQGVMVTRIQNFLPNATRSLFFGHRPGKALKVGRMSSPHGNKNLLEPVCLFLCSYKIFCQGANLVYKEPF